jgi:hypothetical protein
MGGLDVTTERNTLDRPEGMMRSELKVLGDLVRSSGARDILEVGMALGSSTLEILRALKESGDGRLTSIDPFQLVSSLPTDAAPTGYGGQGVENVRAAGLEHLHTLIASPDYLALPSLVQAGRRFDFVFIDGYHSFDYALVDFFFADLLLKQGGMVVFHDSGSHAVYRVCEFVAYNKAYRMIGPRMALIHKSLTVRIGRRALNVIAGRTADFRQRTTRWKSLAAFVKEADGMAEEFRVRGLGGFPFLQ